MCAMESVSNGDRTEAAMTAADPTEVKQSAAKIITKRVARHYCYKWTLEHSAKHHVKNRATLGPNAAELPSPGGDYYPHHPGV